jgi:Grap2 and cyclin-D-interacting
MQTGTALKWLILLSKIADVITNLISATGMVWKTCENVQMIPLSNKAAYRRHIMEVTTFSSAVV